MKQERTISLEQMKNKNNNTNFFTNLKQKLHLFHNRNHDLSESIVYDYGN